jgi:hypothetical protein
MSNIFWALCDPSWKLQIFTKSRAITLKILNKSTWEYPGEQLQMLINIPVKFYNSRSNTFWVTCNTSWKLQNFTKSRAITLKILNKSTWKYTGAQLHMLINIAVRFHDSWSNTFWVTCDTSWKLQNFTKSRALTLTRGPWWPWFAHQKQLFFSVGNYPLSIFSNIKFEHRICLTHYFMSILWKTAVFIEKSPITSSNCYKTITRATVGWGQRSTFYFF